jgi:hypothetical protein
MYIGLPESATTISSRCHRAKAFSRWAVWILGNRRTEFEHPSADCLIADNEATLCQEVLNIAIAQSEPEIKPDGTPDDVR